MNTFRMKHLALVLLLACFFHQGQRTCLDPQGGGIDTGNPKGEPTNDPTKPAIMEKQLEQMLLPSVFMGGGADSVGPKPETSRDTLARGGHELGPKIIRS